MKICKLCKIRPADQTNSHIFPKFLGISILITPDNKRKGYRIDNETAGKKQKHSQDSPKENYILCTSCEGYLGTLEREFANDFYKKFKHPKFNKEFPSSIINEDIKYISCLNVDYQNFKLVVYSMLFRASISSLPFFSDTILEDNQAEKLRQILTGEIDFEDIPILAITSESDKKYTHNYIYSSSLSKNLNYFWANDLIFYLSFDTDDSFFHDLKEITNMDFLPIKLWIVKDDTWNEWRQKLMMLKVHKIKSVRLGE